MLSVTCPPRPAPPRPPPPPRRTVLETTRTLFVWLLGLLLFYTPLGFGKLGESWSVYSWIQAAG